MFRGLQGTDGVCGGGVRHVVWGGLCDGNWLHVWQPFRVIIDETEAFLCWYVTENVVWVN